MLDMGCSQSLIRANVVPWEQLRKSTTKMTCIHGEVMQYERKFIPIRVMEHQGELKMGIAPKLACEVVPGCNWPPIYQVIKHVREAKAEYR